MSRHPLRSPDAGDSFPGLRRCSRRGVQRYGRPADARTRRCGNVSGPFNIRVTATGTSCDIAKRVARHAVVQAQYGANPFSVSTLGQRWTCRVLRDGESISCSRRSGRVGLHPDY